MRKARNIKVIKKIEKVIGKLKASKESIKEN